MLRRLENRAPERERAATALRTAALEPAARRAGEHKGRCARSVGPEARPRNRRLLRTARESCAWPLEADDRLPHARVAPCDHRRPRSWHPSARARCPGASGVRPGFVARVRRHVSCRLAREVHHQVLLVDDGSRESYGRRVHARSMRIASHGHASTQSRRRSTDSSITNSLGSAL